MTWTSHHRRADVLRAVIAAADHRLDGRLPLDVEGVADTFGDELTLLGALTLRWHTRLAGHVERELSDQPLDLENAVALAWLAAAEDMPGIRAVIDHHVAHPTSPEMARTLAVATTKEHEMLALMAGRASGPGEAAARVGRSIEAGARTSYVPGARRRTETGAPSLVQRLKAVLAA
ncbi:hypothetical protein SAMN05192575_10164 [Nocardioides alpinus]|uniref:Uncharacterized protein n=1 Tax=Nocardioides alpinus TaxID=748909 RepID=A0A1I0VBJ9_9ACTN|nr:hypothetical protein [Nocardioides alpinus]PKH37143.1 hypothetical protein CXG46_16745 [Nocardioides alpinus]SFA72956.1 hypothetical protein SAMN05192575_10164 [Nocardioides alpinus]